MEAPGKKVDLEFITNLHKEFIETLGKIKEEASIKRLSAALQISKTYSKLLREYVIEKKFESTDDEINFFKQQKPKFLTHLFFYSAVYQIFPLLSASIPLEKEKVKHYFLSIQHNFLLRTPN